MQARNEHDGYIGAALRGGHRLRHFCRRLEIGKDKIDVAIDELLNRDLQVLLERRPNHDLALDEFCVGISELNHFFLESVVGFFNLRDANYRNLLWNRGDRCGLGAHPYIFGGDSDYEYTECKSSPKSARCLA